MKRKHIVGCFFLVLLLHLNMLTAALQNNEDTININVDGRDLVMEIAPVIAQNYTLVPIRVVMEALGATVLWLDEEKTAVVSLNETRIEIKINDTIAKVNGKDVKLDAPACLIEEKTFVPLRFISEELDASVVWDEASRTVYIDTVIDDSVLLEESNYAFIGWAGILEKGPEAKIQIEIFDYENGYRVLDTAPTVFVKEQKEDGSTVPYGTDYLFNKDGAIKAANLAEAFNGVPNAVKAQVELFTRIKLDGNNRVKAIVILTPDMENADITYNAAYESFSGDIYVDDTTQIFDIPVERLHSSSVLKKSNLINGKMYRGATVYDIHPETGVASAILFIHLDDSGVWPQEVLIIESVHDTTNWAGESVSEITGWQFGQKVDALTNERILKDSLPFGMICYFSINYKSEIDNFIILSALDKPTNTKFEIYDSGEVENAWWNDKYCKTVILTGNGEKPSGRRIKINGTIDFAGTVDLIKEALTLDVEPPVVPGYTMWGGLYKDYEIPGGSIEFLLIGNRYPVYAINAKTQTVRTFSTIEEVAALEESWENVQVFAAFDYGDAREVVFLYD